MCDLVGRTGTGGLSHANGWFGFSSDGSGGFSMSHSVPKWPPVGIFRGYVCAGGSLHQLESLKKCRDLLSIAPIVSTSAPYRALLFACPDGTIANSTHIYY